MSYMFSYSKFNGDISQWNTAKVENMAYMFFNSKFKENIEYWNIFNLKHKKYLFTSDICPNRPYWDKVEDINERQQAYLRYLSDKEKSYLEKNLKFLSDLSLNKKENNKFKI